jgi:hypothetical protein
VFAGIIAAVFGHVLLILVDKDGRVPVFYRLILSAILGFIDGGLIVSDIWYRLVNTLLRATFGLHSQE